MADEIKMPVEGSHIMMFARSVGDDNPIYHDEEYAKTTEVGPVIAPPPFPRSVATIGDGFARVESHPRRTPRRGEGRARSRGAAQRRTARGTPKLYLPRR